MKQPKIVEQNYFESRIILNKYNKLYLNIPLFFPKTAYRMPFKFVLKNKKVLVYYDYNYSHALKRLSFPKKYRSSF